MDIARHETCTSMLIELQALDEHARVASLYDIVELFEV